MIAPVEVVVDASMVGVLFTVVLIIRLMLLDVKRSKLVIAAREAELKRLQDQQATSTGQP